MAKAVAGNDTIFANNGPDNVWGGAGDDLITLGIGDDVLQFRTGDGTDTVTDFGNIPGSNDRIDLRQNSAASSFADLQQPGVITQVGADTHITLGSDQIVLQNFTAGDLAADDFQF